MNPTDEAHLEAARAAARAAGKIQLTGLRTQRHIIHKGQFDLVTDVDRKCEQAIFQILHEAFPQSGFFGEEDTRTELTADEVWIVDPVDGTTNYSHGYPHFSVSIALRRQGRVALGVVYEPTRGELFEAVRGQGAFVNGAPIRVSDTRELAQSLLATGFPYDRCQNPDNNLQRFAAMTMRTLGVRRGGSASLDLAFTACGRVDGYWELRLQPYDVGAGALLVEEAGGRLSDLRGEPFDWTGREVVASNGLLHDTLLESLAQPWKEPPNR
jgi:myo-inositol-1(or 4)-monophosphatase